MYKLNDFNLCEFLTWSPTRQRHCGSAQGHKARVSLKRLSVAIFVETYSLMSFATFSSQWQAPEFVGFQTSSPLSEKADIYALGYVFYFLLTRKEIFPNLSTTELFQHVQSGGVPEIQDEAILNSTHPFDVAMRHAMNMCLIFEPEKRPSARQVVDFLQQELSRLEANEKMKGLALT